MVRRIFARALPFTVLLQIWIGLGAGATIPINTDSAPKYKDVLRKTHKKMQKECMDGDAEMQKRCLRQAKAKQYHAFDQRVSDRLPLDRPIPDTRGQACASIDYDIKTTVSVVIPYYQEATSTLLRTAASVLNRTPSHLLKEVILVSDGAEAPWIGSQRKKIEEYTKKNPKVKFLELKEHLGLAPAKVAGARAAEGEFVGFLDSHCEVNIGWYEPLAAAIEKNRGTISIPIIDSVNSEDFSYQPGGPTRGVFTWAMYFAGEPFDSEAKQEMQKGKNWPIPAMPGGLFLADKAFFEKVGFYDEGLRIWGGENIELSLKTWRCGGQVLLVPCSRVGHVFKSVPHKFPRGESVHKNYKRIAEVWLDEYRDVYYNAFPLATAMPAGDLTEATAVRNRLGDECKSMDWYIENVYPTLFIPTNNSEQGVIKNGRDDFGKDGGCVDTGSVQIASNPMQQPHFAAASLRPCIAHSDYNQWYFMKDTHRLVHIGIWIEECLGVRTQGSRSEVLICQCARYPNSGCSAEEIEWQRSEDGLGLVHKKSGRCLETGKRMGTLQVADCKTSRKSQQWRFEGRENLNQYVPDRSNQDVMNDEL